MIVYLALLLLSLLLIAAAAGSCARQNRHQRMSPARVGATLALITLLVAASPLAAGTPTVNGLFFGDGDLDDYAFLLGDTSGGGKGKVYYGLDGTTVYFALVVGKATANDNVFGKGTGPGAPDGAYLNSAGWPKHEFAILEGSDHATFGVECGATAASPDWNWGMDLLYDADGDLDPAEADWLGDAAGPDNPVAGVDLRFPPSFISSTSLAWNMNNTLWDVTLGGVRTNGSNYKSPDGPLPLYGDGVLTRAGDNYDLNDNSTVGGNYNTDFAWEWSIVYEFSFDFSSCTQGIVINPGTSHNSPSKDGVEDTNYPACLTDPTLPECRSLVFDFGDLPDGPYATLRASNGPYHEISSAGNTYLGTPPDDDSDGQASVDALGDNLDLAGNDEDGVTFLTPLVPGASADIEVSAPLGGFLTAWIDFNSDGDFLDAGEQITATDLALSAGVNTLNIASVPAGATGVMAARFRVTNLAGQGGDSPAGAATTGEVEDYMLACLGSFVWSDLDGDGIQDGGSEVGVENVNVILSNPNSPFFPMVDANGALITATTDANGNYEFCGLPTVSNSGLSNPGEYRVIFDRPAAYSDFSPPNLGGSDALDSDADQDLFGIGIEGLAPLDSLPPVTLVAAQVDNSVDAGLRAVTAALITSTRAHSDGGSVVFEFSTGYEALSASFDVYRLDEASGDYIQVTEKAVQALLGAPQGGAYRVIDQDAPHSRRLTYVVVEHQADGKTQAYGPFRVGLGDAPADTSWVGADMARPHTSERLKSRLAGRPNKLGRKATLSAGSVGGFADQGGVQHTAQVDVREAGLYYVSAADLAATLGLAEPGVRQAVRRGRVVVENRGRAIAWHEASGVGDGLYFFGEAIDSLYTRDNTYWLRVHAPGVPMQATAGSQPSPASGGVFISTERFENDLLPSINATLETEIDYWYWDGINAASEDRIRSFGIEVPNPVAGPAALRARFAGATNGIAADDHHAVVRVNGIEIGEVSWGGMNIHEAEFLFDGALLAPLTTIEVEGSLVEGSAASIFFIDGFEIDYPRTYTASSNALVATGDGNPVITVDGFSSPDLVVFDLRDQALPVLVSQVLVDGGPNGYRASFVPDGAQTPYLVTTLSAAHTPANLRSHHPSIELTEAHHRFEHVIIAPEAWQAEAQSLADFHTRRGLPSLAVSIEQVYNDFSHGNATPWAIRDFLTYARANWIQGPDYAVLAGRGTFDPRDLLGGGDNFVPVVLVGTPNGLIPSDNPLADTAGNDSVPDLAIGRLPIVSAQELATYATKLEGYAAADGEWRKRAVMAADDKDAAGDFPLQSQNVTAILGSFEPQSIDLSTMTTSEARAALLAAWNEGAQLVNYVGHGGVTQAAAEGLLRVTDMDALSNGDRLPIVSALTCVLGRSDIPNLESLAEALVTDPDGGAIAVWGPSGVSISGAAHQLNLYYAARVDSAAPGTSLGEIVLQTMAEFSAEGGLSAMLDTYGIVGDPAVTLP